jgi:hypothetical protein
MSDLGEKRFRIRGKTYVRQDLTLRNGRRKNLQCSHWKLENDKGVKQPCVLFLHGNSGSRVDALPYVQGILSRGMRYVVSVFERSFQSYHWTNWTHQCTVYSLWILRVPGSPTDCTLPWDSLKETIRVVCLDTWNEQNHVRVSQYGDTVWEQRLLKCTRRWIRSWRVVWLTVRSVMSCNYVDITAQDLPFTDKTDCFQVNGSIHNSDTTYLLT